MKDLKFTDAQWAILQPLLPPRSRKGRPRADDRRTLGAILFVLRTGCRWRDLPREYGSPVTAWRRLRRQEEEGVWERLWRMICFLLDAKGKLDWGTAILDGSFAPARRGIRKGTKWMPVVDGTAMGSYPESASKAEVGLAKETLRSLRVHRLGRGRPRTRRLTARAYDSRGFRRYLHKRAIRSCIPQAAPSGGRGGTAGW